MILDVSNISTGEELHQYLADKLGFPGYYGANWDAFWDCITDPEQSRMPSELLLTGLSMLEVRLPRDAHELKTCLLELPEERANIRVKFVS